MVGLRASREIFAFAPWLAPDQSFPKETLIKHCYLFSMAGLLQHQLACESDSEVSASRSKD